MTYCIAIPTINRADLLAESLADIAANQPDVEVLVADNGGQTLSGLLKSFGLRFVLFENKQNLGVAGSWNQLASFAFNRGHDWAWVVNDDIVLGATTGEVEDALSRHEAAPRLLVAPKARYGSFMLPKAVWEAVGVFDEQFFPAYCEDDDYEERLDRAGLESVPEAVLEPRRFRRMSSSARDAKLYDYEKAKARLVAKWGPEIELRLLTR
jgi:GT2 family glycosyltransferase